MYINVTRVYSKLYLYMIFIPPSKYNPKMVKTTKGGDSKTGDTRAGGAFEGPML